MTLTAGQIASAVTPKGTLVLGNAAVSGGIVQRVVSLVRDGQADLEIVRAANGSEDNSDLMALAWAIVKEMP